MHVHENLKILAVYSYIGKLQNNLDCQILSLILNHTKPNLYLLCFDCVLCMWVKYVSEIRCCTTFFF